MVTVATGPRDALHAAGRPIGPGHPAFVIAEVGINHNGDVRTAERLIEAAAQAGADAVKFQTYRTELRVKPDSPIFGILKRCELSFDQQAGLLAHAERLGLCFFSTPFDAESVDFLANLRVPLLKIASMDVVNLALLRQAARTRIPVIMSRGMASAEETDCAVAVLREAGSPFALLHCISAYPTPEDEAHLNVMGTVRARYGCPVGYSDHTLGIDAPVYAVAAGACIIEKHFTLDRTMDGPDHQLSADPDLLARMVARIRAAERALGQAELRLYGPEQPILAYRRHSS